MTTQKSYPFTFKALGNGQAGEFEAAFAVFGNVDLMGDKMMPGSLDESIATWKSSGYPLPVIWQHDWADPFAHIGTMDPKTLRVEDNRLVGKGVIDMNNPFAAQVYNLMKRGTIKEFSFTQLITDERPGKDGSNEIWKGELVEMGPALKGINQNTELLTIKAQFPEAFSQKAGRVLSAKNEENLRAAHAAITEVLSLLGEDEPAAGSGQKSVEPPTAPAEPSAVESKAQEPPTGATAEAVPTPGTNFDEDEFLRMQVEIETAAL